MKIAEVLHQYLRLLETPLGIFQFVALVIVLLSVLAIFISVLVNFAEADKSRKTDREKKSVVETGTMTKYIPIVR